MTGATETNMAEPSSGERNLEALLLQKIYGGDKAALEAEISNQTENHGATNRNSALQKIRRERNQKKLDGVHEVDGYFLQVHHRAELKAGQDRGFSAYLANQDGIQTIRFDKLEDVPSPKSMGLSGGFGEAQRWSGLEKVEFVLSGGHGLRATKGVTKIASSDQTRIGRNLWDLAHPLDRIEDGLGVWQAWINTVFEVASGWENGKPTGRKPILGNGGEANLTVALTKHVDAKTGTPDKYTHQVTIVSENQLKVLLGDMYDESMLMSESGLTEIRDSLRAFPVLVFGSGLTPQNDALPKVQRDAMKGPKIHIDRGPGLIVPYQPSS